MPVAAGSKQRLADDRVVIDAIVGDVAGKGAIVLDDEIATGGSIVELLDMLKADGCPQISVACTHGLFTGKAVERLRDAPGHHRDGHHRHRAPADRRLGRTSRCAPSPRCSPRRSTASTSASRSAACSTASTPPTPHPSPSCRSEGADPRVLRPQRACYAQSAELSVFAARRAGRTSAGGFHPS